jgi:membrane protein
MNLKACWALLGQAGGAWWNSNAQRLGAALAFYATFSLAPLLLVVVAITGLIYGRQAATGHLLGQLRNLVGEDQAAVLQALIAGADQPTTGVWASITAVVMLLVGATGLFVQLQDALNTIWLVQAPAGRGLWGAVKDRFLSFMLVLVSAFLLLLSVAADTLLTALPGELGDGHSVWPGQLIHLSLSFSIITLLFAMIYKLLPDAVIAWTDVWFGSVITSLLFSVGKFLIGLYLGKSAIGSTFGAAGSLAALLLWLYYSAQLFLFGAHLTKAFAVNFGSGIVPRTNAAPAPVTAHAPGQQEVHQG